MNGSSVQVTLIVSEWVEVQVTLIAVSEWVECASDTDS